MFKPKKTFAPDYVPMKTAERNRRLAAMETDPDEAEQAALEAVEKDLNGDFAE